MRPSSEEEGTMAEAEAISCSPGYIPASRSWLDRPESKLPGPCHPLRFCAEHSKTLSYAEICTDPHGVRFRFGPRKSDLNPVEAFVPYRDTHDWATICHTLAISKSSLHNVGAYN